MDLNNYLSNFIHNFEYAYHNLNIYRGIIIINNLNNQDSLIDKLKEYNHLPLVINNQNDINYNYRLFIINDISLLSFLNKNNYNFIAIY
jgi:hypothetical protein